MKKCLLFFPLLILMSISSGVSANGQYNHTTSNVYHFPAEQIQGTKANLWSTDDKIKLKIRTRELTPGDAISVWWVIFNNPEFCTHGTPGLSQCGGPDFVVDEVQADITHAAGGIANRHGKFKAKASLYQGTTPGGWIGHGLINPATAEIHVIVRTHSEPIPGRINEQTMTYVGGCNNVPSTDPGYDDGEPGPNHCENIQFAVFDQNSD